MAPRPPYDPPATPSIHDVVAELLAAWNARDVERAVRLFAPDYAGEDVADAAPQQGRADVAQSLTRYFTAFPDLHIEPQNLVAAADQAALLWTATGTHSATLINIPPTGRRVAVSGVTLLTIRDGLVVRGRHMWDLAGLLREMRLLPSLKRLDAGSPDEAAP